MRILLAEDDEAHAALLSELFADEGYEVVTVATAAEARRRGRGERWDLCLLSPFGRSYDRLATEDLLLLQELSSRAPVIVLTGNAWAMQAQPADPGIAAIVLKPYDIEELLALVREHGGG
jgi:DNA-binding response OmpR family regulator